MNNRNFKVLQGGKSGGIGMAAKGKVFKAPVLPPRMTFIRAEATTTRLMGVVGVVAHYLNEQKQHLTQVIHLDYEEYGIDGYQLFVDESEAHIEQEISKVTGGLGGVFVPLTYEQYRYLIYEAYQIDLKTMHAEYDLLPIFPELLEPIQLDEAQFRAILDLVGPRAGSDYQCLNYGIMRLTGLDHKGFEYLSDVAVPSAWHQEVTSPGTLLKNTIFRLEDEAVVGVSGLKTYRCETLIDYYNRYKLLYLRFQIADTLRGRTIVGIQIETVMNISAYEASFQLRKREHIAVYEILNGEFNELFEELHPEMLINTHGAGDLFTQFNTDNDHVDRAVYYLSDDVYANYYITDEEQLVVSSFSLETLDYIEIDLGQAFEGCLAKIGEMTADQSILYEFVTSGYGNIYEYLDDSKP